MRKRRFLIGAFAVVTGLLMTGTASAAVTGISYTATISPKKQSKKTDFRYQCSECKKMSVQSAGIRAKKVELV
jgi:membrane-bound inhibitor of C-type lysozyme